MSQELAGAPRISLVGSTEANTDGTHQCHQAILFYIYFFNIFYSLIAISKMLKASGATWLFIREVLKMEAAHVVQNEREMCFFSCKNHLKD